MGVSQMELVNKFDNALSGVAGDEGATGALVNSANFLETGSFWDMRSCAPDAGENHDRLASEAAFAMLCGVAPIPATSGIIDNRFRLNYGGDRHARRVPSGDTAGERPRSVPATSVAAPVNFSCRALLTTRRTTARLSKML